MLDSERGESTSRKMPPPDDDLIGDLNLGDEIAAAEKKEAQDKANVKAKAASDAVARTEIREQHPDLVKRTKAMMKAGLIELPDAAMVGWNLVYLNKDRNRYSIIQAILSEEEMVHLDEYRGRIVDHEGTIIDDHYPVGLWMNVFAAARLDGRQSVSFNEARNTLRQTGLHYKRNDLIRRLEKLIPIWDGTPRLESKLIEFFECKDTPLNRQFGKYFWLSFYCRLMMPGAFAPMVLSLFGEQNCGKSFFQTRLVQIITGNESGDSKQLDLSSGDPVNFLREITGMSVIASIGEMTGYQASDLNKTKNFITRTSDPMHYKFEGNFEQPRQWIVVMDANKYEGLQRDDTGNRRFYPMFCGQDEDRNGQPHWRADFRVSEANWAGLEADAWQLMAEAAAWMKGHGTDGYRLFVDGVSTQVKAFSREEMAAGRGTITDEEIEPYLDEALTVGDAVVLYRNVKAADKDAVMICVDKLKLLNSLSDLIGRPVGKFGINALKRAMAARGGEAFKRYTKNAAGRDTTVDSWKFEACTTYDDFSNMLFARAGVNPEDYKDAGQERKLPGGGPF